MIEFGRLDMKADFTTKAKLENLISITRSFLAIEIYREKSWNEIAKKWPKPWPENGGKQVTCEPFSM